MGKYLRGPVSVAQKCLIWPFIQLYITNNTGGLVFIFR